MTDKSNKSIELLLVEDSKTQVFIIRRLLESNGFNIEVVNNGLEALDWLSKHPARPVLTDVTMPEIDGYELCSRLKKDVRFLHIPVILLVSLRANDDLPSILQSRADGFIYKEFEANYFISMLKTLLRQARLESVSGSVSGPTIDLSIGQTRVPTSASQLTGLLLSAFNTAVYCRSKFDSKT